MAGSPDQDEANVRLTFLSLPPETLAAILTLLLTTEETIPILDLANGSYRADLSGQALYCNQLFYKVGKTILYGKNTFLLRLEDDDWITVQNALERNRNVLPLVTELVISFPYGIHDLTNAGFLCSFLSLRKVSMRCGAELVLSPGTGRTSLIDSLSTHK